MGSIGAMRLCSAILGLLLLQGYNYQPVTTQTFQGAGTRAPDSNTTTTTATTTTATTTIAAATAMGSSKTRGEAPQNVTPTSVSTSPRTREDVTILPSPTSESVLTVAAFGVISFIVILVVVVLILAAVVSLRFKCRKNKESEDPQKPGSSGLSESCSTANGDKDSITLISMKNINMNNSKGCSLTEKVL